MRILIIYDSGAADWSAEDVRAVLDCVDATAGALERAGHRVSRVPITADLAWLDAIRGTDLVFNLCEGVSGVSRLEYNVAGAIDLLGIPYTGVSCWTMMICHRKPVLNALLAASDLPVPEWLVPDWGRPVPNTFPLPAIVKPAAEDASAGVDQGSVVTTAAQLEARVQWVTEEFGSAMVQQYIPGREVAVGFVGDVTLPLSEIDFGDLPDGAWPIVTFKAKWSPGSTDDRGTQPVCPAQMESRLRSVIVDIATAAWCLVDGSGYGRVDLRLDSDGHPWILEVNPNPDSSPDAGLANMARAAGWTYDELVLRIVDAAGRASTTPLTTAAVQEPPAA